MMEVLEGLLNLAAGQAGPSPGTGWSQSTSSAPHCAACSPLQQQEPVDQSPETVDGNCSR